MSIFTRDQVIVLGHNGDGPLPTSLDPTSAVRGRGDALSAEVRYGAAYALAVSKIGDRSRPGCGRLRSLARARYAGKEFVPCAKNAREREGEREVAVTVSKFEAWVRPHPARHGLLGHSVISSPSGADGAGPQVLHVMTYNIRHGRGMDMVIDLERLADVIRKADADIVGLNEVDIETERSGGVDQAGRLGELLGMHVVYGPNIEYQGGLYGNALLCRYPVERCRNVSLVAGGRARWGLLHAELAAGGRTLHVLVTHLSLEPAERAEQLQRIANVVKALTGPVVFMGDLNIVAGTDEDPARVLRPLLRDAWTHMLKARAGHGDPPSGYTFPADNPVRRIDYIFINDGLDLAGENAVYTVDTQASDHLPVVAALRWRE